MKKKIKQSVRNTVVRTFSLSHEASEWIDLMIKERVRSASNVMEDIIKRDMREQEKR